MVDRAYLPMGLCGLARAHRANAMAGHLGAALIAGRFFSEEHGHLDDPVHACIAGELDRVIAGEEQWFDPGKAGITVPELFEPFPEHAPEPRQIGTIAKALSRNIGQLRQSGHNVIFAAMALRAFHEHPQYATPPIIAGIRELVEGFDGATAGRQYYGKERGWTPGEQVDLPADESFPPYADERAMAAAVVDELIRTAAEHRQGCGGLWHIINHAAGLTELSRLGYSDLAGQGFAAHRNHIRLWRTLPNLEDELGALRPAEHDPRTSEYWATTTLKRDSARLTHRVKTLYGFFTLTRLIDDTAKRTLAEERFLYLMA